MGAGIAASGAFLMPAVLARPWRPGGPRPPSSSDRGSSLDYGQYTHNVEFWCFMNGEGDGQRPRQLTRTYLKDTTIQIDRYSGL